MTDIEIRQSEIGVFMECRRKWMYEYLRRIEYARSPNQPAPNLSLGTLMHGIVENFWLSGEMRARGYLVQVRRDVQESVDGPLSEDWLKLFRMAEAMLAHYVAWVATGETMHEEVRLIEHQMRVLWKPGVYITGKLDRLVEDTLIGENVLIDVKTTQQFVRVMNHARQLKTYAVLLRREGTSVGRLETEQVRKVLGTGSAKPPFVERSAPMYVNDEILDRHEADMEAVVDEMLALRARWEQGDVSALYPNPTGDCSWKCEYLPLCQAEDNCENTGFIELMSYRPKRGDHI